MRPKPPAFMCGMTPRDHRKVLRMWTWTMRSHSSAGISSTGRAGFTPMPALLTRMSMRPNSLIARAMPSRTTASSAASPAWKAARMPLARRASTASPARAASMSLTNTVAPSPPRVRACSSPMPRAPPVMIATRPSSPRFIASPDRFPRGLLHAHLPGTQDVLRIDARLDGPHQRHAARAELALEVRREPHAHPVVVVHHAARLDRGLHRRAHDAVVQRQRLVEVVRPLRHADAGIDHRTPVEPVRQVRLPRQAPFRLDRFAHRPGDRVVHALDVREVRDRVHGAPDLRQLRCVRWVVERVASLPPGAADRRIERARAVGEADLVAQRALDLDHA